MTTIKEESGKKETVKLNDEQIKNWRKILCVTLGPYAMLMTKEQIQEYKDKMQKNVDKIKIGD